MYKMKVIVWLMVSTPMKHLLVNGDYRPSYITPPTMFANSRGPLFFIQLTMITTLFHYFWVYHIINNVFLVYHMVPINHGSSMIVASTWLELYQP